MCATFCLKKGGSYRLCCWNKPLFFPLLCKMKIFVKFYLQSVLTQAERHFHLSPSLIQEPSGTTLHHELKSSISFMQEQGFFITYLITIIYMRVGPVQQLLLSTLIQWVTGLCKDCLCKAGLFSCKIQYMSSWRIILPLKREQILPLSFKSRDSSAWNFCS